MERSSSSHSSRRRPPSPGLRFVQRFVEAADGPAVVGKLSVGIRLMDPADELVDARRFAVLVVYQLSLGQLHQHRLVVMPVCVAATTASAEGSPPASAS